MSGTKNSLRVSSTPLKSLQNMRAFWKSKASSPFSFIAHLVMRRITGLSCSSDSFTTNAVKQETMPSEIASDTVTYYLAARDGKLKHSLRKAMNFLLCSCTNLAGKMTIAGCNSSLK